MGVRNKQQQEATRKINIAWAFSQISEKQKNTLLEQYEAGKIRDINKSLRNARKKYRERKEVGLG